LPFNHLESVISIFISVAKNIKMKPKIIILIVIFLAISFACKKAPETPSGGNKILIGNTTADSISYNSAFISSTLNSTGGNIITQHGHCWSTSPNPTISDGHSSLGEIDHAEKFSSDLPGLMEHTRYYIRSYISYQGGTIYGEQQEIITLKRGRPVVSTGDATGITTSSVVLHASAVYDSGAVISQKGFVWDTTGNPTLESNQGFSQNGADTGSFTKSLTGLIDHKQYYFLAYATNSFGTSYGNEITFTTLAQSWQCGDTIDYSGQIYNTLMIGTQCWFKENLNIGTRINGSDDQTNNTVIEKYCYNDIEANCNTYGGLYQWDEVMQYVTTEGEKGLCPDGWHIPTHAEWTTLTTTLGGELVAGGKMKEVGTAHWLSPNTGATNSSGFTALPGSYRNINGDFNGLGSYAYFWSSTKATSTTAVFRTLLYNTERVDKYNYSKTGGFSCRCLQD